MTIMRAPLETQVPKPFQNYGESKNNRSGWEMHI